MLNRLGGMGIGEEEMEGFSNLIPCAYRETYRREEWGIGDTNSLADSVFFSI